MSLFGKNGKALSSEFDKVTGLNGRTFVRTQGCWNCKHGDFEVARKWWIDKRDQDLQVGVGLSLQSPLGEKDPKVVQIRRAVANIDIAMAQHALTKCTGPGVDANDNPVGDLVKREYLCRFWSAAQGASVAREGQAADPLPMELEDKKK